MPSLSQLNSYFRLCKKYNEFNAQLGRTGAGMSPEELEAAADDKVKLLLGQYSLHHLCPILTYHSLTMIISR